MSGLAAVAGLLWIAISGGARSGGDGAVPEGQSVAGIALTDIVSGQEISLDDYIGEREIVIVGYMGLLLTGL
ncbi:MAG TPA: hypothetical protein VMR52_04370 [Dehalococcoidia bacterium]|nr:hypothetical protein [Dehalococcoidia bacterium]